MCLRFFIEPGFAFVPLQSFLRRRLRRAEVEFRLAVEAVDERVVASQARMLWAKEHQAVRSVHIERTSFIEPLGANVALPEQVDVSFGDGEVWVSPHGMCQFALSLVSLLAC